MDAMARRSLETRFRVLADEMARPMLYRLARGVGADITAATKRDELVDAVARVAPSLLRRAFATSIADSDLRALCRRLGYSDRGSAAKLATRLMDALEQPTARISRWRPFAEARAFARELGLTGQKAWRAFVQGRLAEKGSLPADIPASPWFVYRGKGWIDWGDFLGTGNPARHLIAYRPFAKARSYAQALGLANATEWRAFCRRREGNRRVLPPDIPSAPDRVYEGKGWVGYGDWLGTGRLHASKIEYRSYKDARAFVRSLGIRTEPEWQAYCRGEIHAASPRPIDVPSNPHRTYRHAGWVSWGEFLGTGSVALYARTFRPYKAARAYVRSQGLVDSKDWRAWCRAGKRPADIPGAPDVVYQGKGWTSWGDFFGTRNVHPGRMRWKTVREAMPIVRALGIRTRSEFLRAKRAGRIPRGIQTTIERRPDWIDWPHFLGTR